MSLGYFVSSFGVCMVALLPGRVRHLRSARQGLHWGWQPHRRGQRRRPPRQVRLQVRGGLRGIDLQIFERKSG